MKLISFWRSYWGRAIVAAIAITVLLATWVGSTSEAGVSGDAWHTLNMGFNIAHQGVVSIADPERNSGAQFVPSNYREPLPPIVLAVWLKILEVSRGPVSYSSLKEGPGVELAKLSNIFWAVILCLSVFAALLVLTQTDVIAVIGAVIVGIGLDVDTLLTEPATAALLALSSFLCMMAIRSSRGYYYYYFFAGLSLGLLTLTKAIFFYVSVGLIASLAILSIWRWFHGLNIKVVVKGMMLLVVGLTIVIGPWMARNLYYFGTAQITQRAGIALMMRANYNQMSWTEYKGSFYVWAPNESVRRVIGSFLGFSQSDLRKGGSLQRLTELMFKDADTVAEEEGSPESAITYYFKARAERVKIARELGHGGHFEPAVDAELERRAIRMVLAEPLKHIIMTVPFLWRAAYFVAPVLALFALLAIRWRRLDLVTFVLPALGMVVLYAMASHNEPRYNFPAGPIAVVCLIALAWYFVSWLFPSGHVIFNRSKTGMAKQEEH